MNQLLTPALYILCACCGYFIGCNNLAHILAKRRGFDIRAVGSNNPGTSNTVITMGWKAGIMVGAHDIFKAFIPAVLAGILLPELALASTVAGVASVLGHIFPVTLGFRGGKGFAPYIGMLFALNWKFGLVIVAVIFLAAIKNVPVNTINAAKLDGSYMPRIYWKLIIPQLKGAMGSCITILAMYALRSFDFIVSLVGYTTSSAWTLPIWMYNEAFQNNNFAYSAAISCFLLALVLVLILPLTYWTNKRK